MIDSRHIAVILSLIALSCVLGRATGATNDATRATPPMADGKTIAPAAPLPAPGEAAPIQRVERDPFWPIGYDAPSRPGSFAPAGTNGASSAAEHVAGSSGVSGLLKIGGVTKRGGKFYAIINGFTYQAGEIVTVPSGGEVYKFLIEKIDFKKLQIKPVK